MKGAPGPGPIARLLVANRGEIAERVIRAAHALGMTAVAVYSDVDRDAPFVAAADEAVALGGRTATESYLNIGAIVGAATRAGADAVHPGYGFLSENAAFAQAVVDAGLLFVGPAPDVIATMGSKLAARALAESVGVPVLPGRDLTGVAPDKLTVVADELGWPLLVKASAGGGGRGMRVVAGPAELADAVASAAREAESAFGDATLFLERYLERPRHIEVQILGDHAGNVVSLFERDCSVQRRHQKVIEEAPSPAVGPALRHALGAAAAAVARQVGYVGAGTVEFVVEDGAYWFLEMNTRLQVEHAVTEQITGLDLVGWQLRVAQGEAVDEGVTNAVMRGHSIEARLYAEDPAAGWRPTAGTIHRFRVPPAEGVRVDSGVADGSVVSIEYDPMLAKVIAHGANRADAAARLARALRQARIHGPGTNRDLLVAVLSHSEFRAGTADTAFFTRHPPDSLLPQPERRSVEVACVAAALAQAAASRRDSVRLQGVPSGFRNNPSQLQIRAFRHNGVDLVVGYRLDVRPAQLEVDGVPLDKLELDAEPTPDAVVLVDRGMRAVFEVHDTGPRVFVDGPGGSFAFERLPRFPAASSAAHAGSLVAPMPGRVVRVETEVGQVVVRGQLLVVVEAMKMEHRIVSPEDGTVAEVAVAVGDVVDASDVLAVVDRAGPNPASRERAPENQGTA